MLDPIWDEIATLKLKMEKDMEINPGNNNETRCGWCHRRGLHLEGKSSCPGKDLNATQARKLLKGVPKSLGMGSIKEQGCAQLVTKIAGEPGGDIDTMIAIVRKEHFNMDA